MKTRSWLWVTSLVCICGLSGCHNESEGGTETPVETEAVCGDGVLAESEDCDDGNTISGDGCSDDCIQELGYDCASGICQVIAGTWRRL